MLTKPEKGLTCGEVWWSRTGRLFYFVLCFCFFFLSFSLSEKRNPRVIKIAQWQRIVFFFQFDLGQLSRFPISNILEKGEQPDVKQRVHELSRNASEGVA